MEGLIIIAVLVANTVVMFANVWYLYQATAVVQHALGQLKLLVETGTRTARKLAYCVTPVS